MQATTPAAAARPVAPGSRSASPTAGAPSPSIQKVSDARALFVITSGDGRDSHFDVPVTPVEGPAPSPRARSASPAPASSPTSQRRADTIRIDDWRTMFERPDDEDLEESLGCFDGESYELADRRHLEFFYADTNGPPIDFAYGPEMHETRQRVRSELERTPMMLFSVLSSDKRAEMVERFIPSEWLAQKMREMRFSEEFVKQTGERFGAMAAFKQSGDVWRAVRRFHNGNVKTLAECLLFGPPRQTGAEPEAAPAAGKRPLGPPGADEAPGAETAPAESAKRARLSHEKAGRGEGDAAAASPAPPTPTEPLSSSS